jgi:uncharacterized protein (TIGR03000 family)
MHSTLFSKACATLACGVLIAAACEADAGWHHRHGGSAGSHGGSYGGSDGGSYGGSDGGSYGSGGGNYGSGGGSSCDYGSHGGGRRHGWMARKHGSAGGSTGGGSYGSGGGSYGSGGGSYGGSAGGSAGGVPSFTPALAAKVEVPKDGVVLTVEVPAEARVFVNGKETSQLGATRVFTSKGLTAGKKYDFVVKMQTVRDGKPLEETKTVSLVAGDRQAIAMAGQPAGAAQAALAVSTPPAKP